MKCLRNSPRTILGTLIVIGAGVIYACVGLDAPTASPKRRNEATGAAAVEGGGRSIGSSPELRARFAAARAKVKPLMKVHHDAMKDLRANYGTWSIGVDGRRESSCSIAMRLAVKHAVASNLPADLVISDARRLQAIYSGVRRLHGCETATASSIFGAPHATPIVRVAMRDNGPFLYLYDEMVNSVMNGWDGLSDLAADVDSAVQAMPYQYPLYDDDVEYLAAKVEFVSSSWGDAMELPYPDDPEDTYELSSLFMRMRWPGKTFFKKVLTVALSDLSAFTSAYTADQIADPEATVQESVAVGLYSAAAASTGTAAKCIADESPCKAEK